VVPVKARTLGSQVRILLEAWICVCVSLCCVVLCRQRAWRWTDPPPKESYQMSKGSISKKEKKSDALKRHKGKEKEEEEGSNKKFKLFMEYGFGTEVVYSSVIQELTIS
jgi:hypothetical protein